MPTKPKGVKMREIKFRIYLREWDEKGGMMYYDCLPLGGWDKWWVKFEGEDSYDGEFTPGREIEEPMQFTGLKDKNGKEIYEGDILANLEEGSEKAKHECWHGLVEFGIYNGTGLDEWQKHNTPGFFAKGLMFKWELCEVIGNIYENPELLEPHPKAGGLERKGE